jgi:hypothetical protein
VLLCAQPSSETVGLLADSAILTVLVLVLALML